MSTQERRTDMKDFLELVIKMDERHEKVHTELQTISAAYGEITTMQDDVKKLNKNVEELTGHMEKVDTKLFNHGMGYIQQFEKNDKELAAEQEEIKKNMNEGFKSIAKSIKNEMAKLITDVVNPMKKKTEGNEKK